MTDLIERTGPIYIGNNIRYRQVAASAISEFKQTQAFIYGQLLNSSYEFQSVSKELIALISDRWSVHLSMVDRVMLRSGPKISTSTVNVLSSLFQETFVEYYTIVRSVQFFTDDFVIPWIKTHNLLKDYIYKTIVGLEGMTIDQAFITYCSTISKFINHVLFEVYEIDLLISKKEVKLFYDDVAASYSREGDLSLIGQRLEIYLELKLLDDIERNPYFYPPYWDPWYRPRAYAPYWPFYQ